MSGAGMRGGTGMFYQRTSYTFLTNMFSNGRFSNSFTVNFPTNNVDAGPRNGTFPTDPRLTNGPVVDHAVIDALAGAIALALALFGIEREPPAALRLRVSPFQTVGYRAATGWVTLGRWADAVRARRLFPQVRPCPARFTRRQVAERAATTIGSRAPPPMEAPLVVRAFNGAAHAW